MKTEPVVSMKTYRVPVVWTMMGYVTVQAADIDDAIDAADEAPLPDDGSYLDDSFEIETDGIEEVG